MTELRYNRNPNPADPARVQRDSGILSADDCKSRIGKVKKNRAWTDAIIELRSKSQKRSQPTISCGDLFRALKITQKQMRSRHRGMILKNLVKEGILLRTGQPNPENPVVSKIANARSTDGGKKKKHRVASSVEWSPGGKKTEATRQHSKTA